ncbi:MAG: ACT domain-containing protein [Clostridia bacterium]|nr:ACT domain-containing protein [Clostridia bacterium]
MIIKQISIFVENRHGRLAEITDILGKNKVNIRAVSIADTTDFGILRIIVDDPDNVVDMLAENSITASLTSVLSVPVDDNPGGLAEVLNVLAVNDITVDYMYAYISHADDRAYVILRTEKEAEAEEILRKNGFSNN